MLDAALFAPTLTLTAADAAAGAVPRLQAEASERDGPVLRSAIPTGPDAGPCLFLVGPEVAEEVMLSKVAAFSSREGWGHVLGRGCGEAILNTDDPLHAEQRRLWAPALTGEMIKSHWPALERAIDKCIEPMRSGLDFDAYPVFRALAFRAIAVTFAGLPEQAIEPAYRAICIVLDGQDYARESRETYVARANAARSELAAIVRSFLSDLRKRRPAVPGNLLDLLLECPVYSDHADPDDGVRSHLTMLLIAGHETGATMFSRAAFVLAEQPAVAERLWQELEAAGWSDAHPLPISDLDRLPWLERFVLEVGRLYPSLINLPRVMVDELAIGGYRVVPGTRVAVAAAATHLLRRLHRDPLRFDLERYADVERASNTRPFQMLTFAGGSRICMGMRFAQLEFKAIVARLASRLQLAALTHGPVPHTGFWNARPGAPLRIRAQAR
jgi:retinoid hydroxylase